MISTDRLEGLKTVDWMPLDAWQLNDMRDTILALLRVAQAAEKLVVRCNHKPDGWDVLDESLKALRGSTK